MKDLQQDQRRFNYWLRRNKDNILAVCALVVFVCAFWIFPALGLYIVS
jgi:hypothetical protein